MSRILNRPMFRKGGSAGEGITSGLAPRQGYQGTGNAADQSVQPFDLRNATMDQIRAESQRQGFKAPPMAPDNSLRDFKIDFGLDLVSRSPGGNIFQTAGLAAKDPFNRFRASKAAYNKAAQDRAINKYNSESDMFKTLIGAQADILGSEGAAKTYKDQWVADKLEAIVPELFQLNKKDPATLTEEEQIRLETLQLQKNNLTKSNPVTEGAIDIFVKSSKGQTIFMEISEDLLDKNKGKYTGENDPQLIRDAIEEVKKILGAFSGGGRAGYAAGELVEEQVTETETMAPGPTAQSDNPISYEQLRARLPAEITDDIVELMANSAEALEDFAMISSQQDVDLFNQKYSVNLVLPSGA